MKFSFVNKINFTSKFKKKLKKCGELQKKNCVSVLGVGKCAYFARLLLEREIQTCVYLQSKCCILCLTPSLRGHEIPSCVFWGNSKFTKTQQQQLSVYLVTRADHNTTRTHTHTFTHTHIHTHITHASNNITQWDRKKRW